MTKNLLERRPFSMKLFIGIDASSKDLQVAFTDSEHYDKPLVNKSFSNDLIGANEV